jgi:hypothetical protein
MVERMETGMNRRERGSQMLISPKRIGRYVKLRDKRGGMCNLVRWGPALTSVCPWGALVVEAVVINGTGDCSNHMKMAQQGHTAERWTGY